MCVYYKMCNKILQLHSLLQWCQQLLLSSAFVPEVKRLFRNSLSSGILYDGWDHSLRLCKFVTTH